MKRPFFRAQFWKSNTTRRHHQVLSRAFAPECLQCAPCPARRWVASAVVKAAGAFRFPFVGTYARSSVVVAAGVSPAQAWEDFHSHEVPRLAAVDVLNLASGLWPTDLLPDHINKLLRHVESQSHPGGATPAQLWVVWRHWQQGRQMWREPAYEAIPSWAEGRLNESARAHRALWLLLGALVSGMEVLPAPCLSCGRPSVLQCRRCASAVCRDCLAQCTRCS